MLNSNFYIVCIIVLVMIGLIWAAVDTICYLLNGAEKPVPGQETEPESSECKLKSDLNKQSKTSLDIFIRRTPSSQSTVFVIDVDLKYLTNYGIKNLKTEQYTGLSLIKYFKKDLVKCQLLTQTSKKHCTGNDTMGNVIKSNALLPTNKSNKSVSSTTSALIINWPMYQSDNSDYGNKLVILGDEEVKDISFSTRKTFYKDTRLKETVSTSFAMYNGQRNQNRTKKYFYIELGENELRAIKKIAQYITKSIQLANSATNSSCLKDRALKALEFHESSCDTTVKTTFSCRNSYSLKVHGNKTFASISIIELDSVEDNALLRRTLVENSEKLQKEIKLIKERSGRKQKNNKSRPQEVIKYRSGYLELLSGRNESCTNSKLLMEIERQLKPIKNQVNELEKSLADFSVANFQRKRVKSTILSVNSLTWSSSRSHGCIRFHSYNQHVTKRVEDYYSSEDNLQMDKQKTLSPLAQMYIQLSKHNLK